MSSKENENISHQEIEYEDHVKYSQKYFFCCNKLIRLDVVLTKTDLLLYSNEQKTKLFKKIPKQNIIAINKRQIDKNDVFKFSIYYQLKNETKITELKLKARNKSDTDKWIDLLRKNIHPKKYVFSYNKDTQEDASLLFPFTDTRKLYLSLCHLEYILHRRQMMEFYEYYKNSKEGGEKPVDVDDIDVHVIDN